MKIKVKGPRAAVYVGLQNCRKFLYYLEGQGDLGSTLIKGILGVIICLIGVTNLLTKSP